MEMRRVAGWGLRLYRAMARAFPQEFLNAYGDEMVRAGEDAIEPVWRRRGLLGLARLLGDMAVRLPAEYAAEIRQDVRYGLRVLAASPGFTAAAVATVALGIAAAATVFSVTSAVLLRPLPYRAPDRLVVAEPVVSNALYHDFRSQATSAFAEMGAVMVYRAIVPREDGSAERITKAQITTNFFRLLGARIVLGRDFEEADGRPPARLEPIFPPPEGAVAILSHEYFMRRYGGDAAILGRRMPGRAGAGPRIVGVLAPGFKLLLGGETPDVWIANNRGYDAAHRGDLMLTLIGRLKDGATVAQAQAELDTVGAHLKERVPAGGSFDYRLRLENWQRKLNAGVRPALTALTGAVLFLLLIACANVANLLLVRVSLRERELAVRAALGAGRGRLALQMLAEAALVAGLGTVAGICLSWLAVRELPLILPAGVPRSDTIAVDWRVLLFAAAAGAVECGVFGATAGWRAAPEKWMDALRGRTAGTRSGRVFRNGVVVAEVALAFVLLTGSGLMVRSFVELRRVEPGFRPDGVLTFLAVGDARGFEEPGRRLALLADIREKLTAIPGVQSAGGAMALPLAGSGQWPPVAWGRTAAEAGETADLRYVLPGYFEALETPIVAGRVFRESDNAPGRNVAVIDEALAERAFPRGRAVGKRIFVSVPEPAALEIIGVSRHQRLGSLAAAGPPQIFVSDGFFGVGISRHWAVRTKGDPARYAGAARAAVAAAAPGRLAVTEMEPMEAAMDRARAGTRFELLLIGSFAGLAALLAAVGLYGVLASAVRQRTAEIGVRVALGASPGGIFRLVVGEGLRLSAAGIAIGAAGALGVTRAMSSMLVGVGARDPETFAAVAAGFLAIAIAASWVPARRALRVDPARALRQE